MNRKLTIRAAALTGLALTAGCYLISHATRTNETDPAATALAGCMELQRPDDPNGVIGSNWPGMSTCDKLASSATIFGTASIALRSAAGDIRTVQIAVINAAHPNAAPDEARRTIRAIRSDLAAALDGYAVMAVGATPTDRTRTL